VKDKKCWINSLPDYFICCSWKDVSIKDWILYNGKVRTDLLDKRINIEDAMQVCLANWRRYINQWVRRPLCKWL
jgi:hypothetical protein